jgi:CheY-like chemotaxis protein
MKHRTLVILVVEDSADDQLLVRRAFENAGNGILLAFVNDGTEAIKYLQGRGSYANRERFPYPSFILTDLKMSPADGFAVLEYLRKSPGIIPAIVFSGSEDLDDVKKAYLLGASGYLVKPQQFETLCQIIKTLYDLWQFYELPAVDQDGNLLYTSSQGKLGERIKQM